MNIRYEITGRIRKFNWRGFGIEEPPYAAQANREMEKVIIRRVVLAEKSKI